MTRDQAIEVTGGWTVWPWVLVRGAGFPCAAVLDLAPAEDTTGAWIEAEAQAIEAGQAAAALLLDRAFATEPPSQPLLRAASRLRKGRPVAPLELPPELSAAIAAAAGARDRAQALGAEARAGWDAARLELEGVCRRWARDPALLEAVWWQSAPAAEALTSLGRDRPEDLARRQRLLASYLQRYATKNDTIGFFGPVGWAPITTAPTPVAVRFGGAPSLGSACAVRLRVVRFERWAVDALARRWSADEQLRPQLAPRLRPTVRLQGDQVWVTSSDPPALEVDADTARVLALADGARSAAEIAAEAGVGLELIEELAESGLLLWRFEIPVWDLEPERALRRQVLTLSSSSRGPLEEELDRWDSLRSAIAAAAGDPRAVGAAVADLDRRVAEVTGAGSGRGAGRAYAGRRAAYEDCVRDAEHRIDPGVLHALAPALEPLLLAARWLTAEVAAEVRREAERVFVQLAGPQTAIDYARFWLHLAPLFDAPPGGLAAPVAAARGRLIERWRRIFGELEGRRVAWSAARLTMAAGPVFAAPGPGWPFARHHSPDLALDASPEELDRGEWTAVLGELHLATSSLFAGAALSLHPDPGALFSLAAADLPRLTVVPVEAQDQVTRADYLPLKADLQLEIGASRSPLPRERVRAIADWRIHREEEGLVVQSRDGVHRLELITFLQQVLSAATVNAWALLPDAPHIPRITVDRLVVQRERWSFSPDQWPFCQLRDPFDRFAGARRWARRHGMPRFLFLRTPQETKPMFLDLHSPLSVEVAARMLSAATGAVITEMLPAPDRLWLRDREGRGYTSELRFTLADRCP